MINGPLDFPADHPMLEHFKFVAANTKVTPKISIPGPSAHPFPHRRGRHPRRRIQARCRSLFRRDHRDLQEGRAGVLRRRLPLPADGRHLLRLSLRPQDPRRSARRSGEDPDWLIGRYAKMMHDAIADRPDDMLIGMHMCRGNFKSTWVAEGAYDPAADAIFNQTDVDIYFMEYDSDRAGGFEPLRLLPKGKKRVLPGFITTKTAELEELDDLKRKFEAGQRTCRHRPARHRPAMRLRLHRGGQCDHRGRPEAQARAGGADGRGHLGRRRPLTGRFPGSFSGFPFHGPLSAAGLAFLVACHAICCLRLLLFGDIPSCVTALATILAIAIVVTFGAAAVRRRLPRIVVRLRGSGATSTSTASGLRLKRGGMVPDDRVVRIETTGNVEFQRGN